MKKRIIKILLANDNKTIRKGFELAFEAFAPHLQIVEQSDSFKDLLKKLPPTEFDILMSDDIMEGEHIITYLPGIKEQYPAMKIILNSIFTEEVPHLIEARKWINGWVSFASEPSVFIETIENVFSNGYFFNGNKEKV